MSSTPDDNSMNGGEKSTESASSSARKKRKKTAFDVDPFITRPETNTVCLKCCAVVWKENKTRVRKHFMSCQSFRRKFPTAYLELSESRTDTSTIDGKQTEVTSHFRSVSPQLREKLDKSFADAILKDGLPFNTCQSPNWNPFWTLVFGSAYKIPHREKISDTFLPISFDGIIEKCTNKLKEAKEICLSIDGFSDIRSRSVFHAMFCFPIPLHAQSFRLGSERESAVNMNKKIATVLNQCSQVYHIDLEQVYGFVTDSPNVMTCTRKLCTGSIDGGVRVAVFAYGCACHGLSLVIKDIVKIPPFKDLFKKIVLIASYFKNTHLANHLLELERKKLTPTPKTIKTFSLTRWNGCAVMMRSVLDCRQAITHVFSNELTKPSNEEQLLDISDIKSKAYSAFQLSLDRTFWSELEKLTPILEVFSSVLTYVESDLCPLSLVPLAYATLRTYAIETLDVNTAKIIGDSLVSRYNVIASDVHILAMVLDPAISTDRYADMIPFLNNRPVLCVAQAAMEVDLQHAGASSSEIEECTRQLATFSCGGSSLSALSTTFHPLLWWMTIGMERCKPLSALACRVFSLTGASAGVERSFKVRSHLHGKNRCQLSDSKADKQCSLIYNSGQLDRMGSGVLASKRGGAVFDFIVKGYFKFKQQSGSDFADLVSTTSRSSADFSSDSALDVDRDDEDAFRNITEFAENIDDVFGASI